MTRRVRTPAQRLLTWRRSERTRRATSITRTIQWVQTLAEPAVPFWRDQVLYEDVRTLARLVREWGWIDPPPRALALVDPPRLDA